MFAASETTPTKPQGASSHSSLWNHTYYGTLVEVQGTGEGATFTRSTMDQMMDFALAGCSRLSEAQAAALAEPVPGSGA